MSYGFQHRHHEHGGFGGGHGGYGGQQSWMGGGQGFGGQGGYGGWQGSQGGYGGQQWGPSSWLGGGQQYSPESGFSGLSLTDYNPRTDVFEDDKNFYVNVEAPEFNKDQISIDIRGSESMKQLVIAGRAQEAAKREGVVYYSRERLEPKNFQKVIQLPPNVNTENIDVALEHGVLNIMIPKAEGTSAEMKRRIMIQDKRSQQPTYLSGISQQSSQQSSQLPSSSVTSQLPSASAATSQLPSSSATSQVPSAVSMAGGQVQSKTTATTVQPYVTTTKTTAETIAGQPQTQVAQSPTATTTVAPSVATQAPVAYIAGQTQQTQTHLPQQTASFATQQQPLSQQASSFVSGATQPSQHISGSTPSSTSATSAPPGFQPSQTSTQATSESKPGLAAKIGEKLGLTEKHSTETRPSK